MLSGGCECVRRDGECVRRRCECVSVRRRVCVSV